MSLLVPTASIAVRRALLSVSDAAGLAEFARALVARGVDILATTGTRGTLAAAGVAARDVSDVTGFPSILGGRVKTLHPAIHAGILYRRGHDADEETMRSMALEGIDLVVVTLYPFEEAVARGAADEELVETIDVGGPTMIRAAAKNHAHVAVVTSPAQYARVLADMETLGGVPRDTARALASEAFLRLSAYDRAIATALAAGPGAWPPPVVSLAGGRAIPLRYGENPHQRGALYADLSDPARGWGAARALSGKELSYTNVLDLEAAAVAVAEFDEPAAVIVKHATPCGVAERPTLADAFTAALAGDPESAYGCVVAVNRAVDRAAAEAINATPFLEALGAPAFPPDAFELLKNRKTRRFVELPAGLVDRAAWSAPLLRAVRGGVLAQDRDARGLTAADLRTVTRRAPTDEERAALLFAWRVVRHARSNAVVLARDSATVGIGAGVTSRVLAVQNALRTAGERARGAVLASDGFFPMADGVELAAAAGVTAIIQPGGSIRDEEVVAAADAAGLAMIATGVRCFVH